MARSLDGKRHVLCCNRRLTTNMNLSMPNWFDMLPTVRTKSVLAMVDGGATTSRAVIADAAGKSLRLRQGRPDSMRAQPATMKRSIISSESLTDARTLVRCRRRISMYVW